MVAAVLATSTFAFADAPKVQRQESKLGRDAEARVYVLDKDVPSLDKTVTIARPQTQPASKNK
jgi:hypothetical protein